MTENSQAVVRVRKALGAALFLLTVLQIYSLALQQVAAGLAIALALTYLALDRFRSLRGDTLIVALAFVLFVTLRATSVGWSAGGDEAIKALQFPLLALVFLPYMLAPEGLGKFEVGWLMRMWVAAAALAAMIASARYFMGMESRIGPPFGALIMHPDRLAEGNYSTMAKFLAYSLAFFGPFLLGNKQNRSSIWSITGLVIMGSGLLLTFSRSGWLAAAVVYGYLLFRFSRPLLFAGLVIGVAVVALLEPVRARFEQSLSPTSWSTGRVELWEAGMKAYREHPFIGNGIGSFETIVTEEIRATFADKGVGDWHNQYLQLLVESGAIGLLVFALLLGAVLYSLRTPRGRRLIRGEAPPELCGRLLIVACLITGLFEQQLSSPSANIFFWSLLGLGVGWARAHTAAR